MASIPLAHAGHYLVWVLYLIPVVIVVAAAANSYRVGRQEDDPDGS